MELEAEGNLDNQSGMMNVLKSWLAQMALHLKADIEHSSMDLQNLPSDLLEKGKAQLNIEYSQSLEEVMAVPAPEQCTNNGQLQLLQLHKRNMKGLFCKNMTYVVKDILKMVLVVGKVSAQILLTSDDLLNGLGRCFSWNPFKFVYCSYVWFKDTVRDISRTFSYISNFNKELSVLEADLKNEFESCFQSSTTEALENKLAVIKNIEECSKKSL